jgi:predicted helicase
LIDFGREKVMCHLLNKENIGLTLLRQSREGSTSNFCVFKSLIGKDAISSLDTCTVFPLYKYISETTLNSNNQTELRLPNLNHDIVMMIANRIDLIFTNEKKGDGTTFAPIDILDYIYSVLHSPTYREKYKEFLKIDFPRIPYPKDQETFWQLVKLGGELRQIHLMESSILDKLITRYPVSGSNEVGKVRFETYNYEVTIPREKGEFDYPDYLGLVYINDTQYFANVPTSAWEFYIGGYQPAQKWLKDRKGRTLGFEDILHYQKIVVALTETDRLMKEIDKVEIE